MAVVVEQKIGHTTIRIHDDYCRDTTGEQVAAILRRIAVRAQADLSAAAAKEVCAEQQGKAERVMYTAQVS